MKLLCLTNLDKQVLFISEAYHGSCHDYRMLKNEFNPQQGKWFDNIEVLVDLGFLGIRKDYCEKVKIPIRKTRKKELTQTQKEYNKSISAIRIKVEHSIGGIKRFRILSDRLRLRNMTRYNQIVGICAGLWNYFIMN